VIILDTNIISELMRPKPEASVVAWLNAQHENEIATTTIAEAELRYGICRLPHGRRREQIQVTVEQILREFSTDRILSFDQAAAREYGEMAARREHNGLPISAADCQIASIVLANRAKLATRNTKDFLECGIELINPWQI